MRRFALRAWRQLGQLGVAARLSIAFIAVALLAVAANLLVQHGVSTVRTTTLRSAAPAAPNATLSPHVQAVARAEHKDSVSLATESLLAALGEYGRAVERRADGATPSGSRDLAAAGKALDEERDRFLAVVGADPRDLEPLVSQARSRAATLIAETDRRRSIVTEYWDRFERVDARFKAALDRNWKIFGRVITRQSLLTLSRDLDDIRRHSARLNPAGATGAEAFAALAEAQGRFTGNFEGEAKNLGRSQGTGWAQSAREEFAKSVALSTELAALDPRILRAARGMEDAQLRLTTKLRAIVAAASGPRADSQALQPRPALNSSPANASPGALALPAPPGAHTTVETQDNHGARVLIGTISAAVLLLLLVICIATVRSVVTPIRRLIATAERLGRGEPGARVKRGGARELDALAVAFNGMAEKLHAAQTLTRDYQAQLEARVDERTRQLQHLAEHDALTGLPNRRQLLPYLQSSIRKASRVNTRLGVFFLDLDNFKNINDSMGHAFGDLVLERIAERLREATASAGFAARLGGDEFTVICENFESIDDVRRFGAQLVCAFESPLVVEGRDLVVGVSVGASIYPEHESDADALLRAADAALFQAKTSGRSRLSVFSPELLAAASLKFRIEQGLRHAAERGEFVLLFQPEVSFDLRDTKVVEALLRWRLPDGRDVSPADFLPVAEESGLIVTISEWVLSCAIETAARWHHGDWPDVRVAINVSAKQLLDNHLVERVELLLRQHRLPARCIEIELTENVLQTGPTTIETLKRLRSLGVAIALDDFGTGYSSLASLELLPLTRVKLDRSLIASIDTSARSLAIAQSIIGLCRSLGLEVTAEGVERPEQLALLLEHPSVYLQGYLISRPLEADQVPRSITAMGEHMTSLLLTAGSGAVGGARSLGVPAGAGASANAGTANGVAADSQSYTVSSVASAG